MELPPGWVQGPKSRGAHQVGVVGCAMNLVVLGCMYKETLPAEDRKPLSIKGSD
jgi:hypothetical protein